MRCCQSAVISDTQFGCGIFRNSPLTTLRGTTQRRSFPLSSVRGQAVGEAVSGGNARHHLEAAMPSNRTASLSKISPAIVAFRFVYEYPACSDCAISQPLVVMVTTNVVSSCLLVDFCNLWFRYPFPYTEFNGCFLYQRCSDKQRLVTNHN